MMAQSMYVHIPFCDAICAYCDFFRCGYHRGLSEQYLEALKLDLAKQQPSTDLKTLYIGGGTPTSLQSDQLEALFQLLKPYRQSVEEYTVEVNVESLHANKISCMHTAGVNRISMGVQSFHPDLLHMMNRRHRTNDVVNAIQDLKKVGIHNISIDLIYGLPTQTMAMWEADLLQAAALPITHISLYALTIEEHSAFGRMGVTNIDPTLEGEMYDKAIQTLEKKGFHQYEISSFARTGYESMHNKQYWYYHDFYGIGCGASGKLDHQRYDMPKNLHAYIKGEQEPSWITLSQKDEMFEMVMMGLRLKEGLSYQAFEDAFHVSFDDVFKQAKEINMKKGELYECHHHLRATDHGLHFLNDVLLEFL